MKGYTIITPAHNEEAYICFTLDSVIAQTVHPVQWIIVDDGSTDHTANIVHRYADKNPWIKLIKSTPQEGKRQGGAKVVRAFNRGYQALDITDFEFVVKLDADLSLPSNYFEEVARTFEAEPLVGMCGGYLSEYSNGAWERAQSAGYHLRGAIKAYRKKCLQQIGGIPISFNWDSIDEMRVMSLGWTVKILPIEVKHHRKTSTLINRGLNSSFFTGKQYYKDGYDLFLALCRSATFGIRTKPYILSSFGFLLGFLYNCWHKPKKDVDPGLEAFIRRFQYLRVKNILKKS